MILPGVLSAAKLGMGADVFQSGAPDFSGFTLTVNPDFNPTRGQRKLKDGTPFTPVMDDIYDGLFDFWIGGPGQNGSTSASEARLINALTNGSSYRVGRNGHRQMVPLYIFFRLTGDVRLLDEMVRLGEIAYANMWRPGHPDAGPNGWLKGFTVSWDYHGERTWVSDLSGYGHDDHLSDTPRAFRTFANLAWALELNRGVVSPKGYNYGALADKWRAVFEGYERVWSRHGDGLYPPGVQIETAYRGRFRNGNYVRADSLPYNTRSTTHTQIACGVLSYFAGRILGRDQEGIDGYSEIFKMFFEDEVFYVNPGPNEKVIYMRAFHNMSSSSNYLMPIVYADMVYLEVLDMYLEGNPGGHIDLDRFMRGAVRSYDEWVLEGTASSFTCRPDIGGGVDRTGTLADGSKTLTIIDACEGRNGAEFCSNRTMVSWGLMAQGVLVPWDDTGRFTEFSHSAHTRYFADDDSLAKPYTLPYPLGVFLKEAGIFA